MNQKLGVKGQQALSSKESVDRIRSRADFAEFVGALITDLRDKPEEWENEDLASFLAAVKAWVEDMDGYFKNIGERTPEQPSWKTLAQILLAAKVYE
jgi:hypothetical protein